MWIVAVAWIYVVALMAATEPTVVHGIMTFLFYCALPLSIVFYLTGSKRRRARREALARRNATAASNDGSGAAVPAMAADKCGRETGACDGGDGGD